MPNFRIRLEGLRFYARIGVDLQERSVGNDFILDIAFSYPAETFLPENLDTTVSYADVYEVAKIIMAQQWLLLETAAKKIADTMGEKWPSARDISVKLTKTAPPIPGIQGCCSVEYIEESSKS